MNRTDLLYTLALQHTPNIGDITAKRLINHCGSAEAVLKESPRILQKINGIGSGVVQALSKKNYLKEAEAELNFIEKEGLQAFYFEDKNYPEKLKHCIDGPILLFQSGKIDLKQRHIISIVGTRKITNSGVAFCENLIETLAVYKPLIVSGFAYGTDITAHKAAMQHRLQTIGCLAHGFHTIYPKVHKKYMAQMETHGGFLSEFWSTDTFDKKNFLKRNRVIAGLSEATIVIESAKKGGSLVTADIANSYNREVFAVPGRTTDSLSEGCNNLIKHQRAHMLTTPLDVPYILGWELESKQKPAVQKQLFVELDSEEKVIYNYLKDHDKQQLDTIAIHCEMPIYKVAGILLNMELKGIIRPLPGKLFEII